MVDPVNDMLYVVTIPVSIVLISAIYTIGKAFLETRGDCSHTWSRWSDIKHGDGHPYQLRFCNKCNLHEQRLVQ